MGCVRSTTCSEVPATWELRRCGAGGPAILRVSIWRSLRAETLHPCNPLTYLPLLEDLFFFLSKGRYPFSSFERGIIHEICQHPPYYLLSSTGEVFDYSLFHYSTNALSTCDWHVLIHVSFVLIDLIRDCIVLITILIYSVENIFNFFLLQSVPKPVKIKLFTVLMRFTNYFLPALIIF